MKIFFLIPIFLYFFELFLEKRNKNIQKEVDVYLKQRIKIEPKNLKMFFDKSGYAYEKIELKG